MNELIKYFNKKYSKTHGKIAYPRTTLQIYQVYQIIKSSGIEDEKLNKLLNETILPKPKTTEEKEAYAECIYESVNIPASRKYVDESFPKKTSIEDKKIYLLKENGEKIDKGTELPSLQEQAGQGNTIQIFTDLATTEVTFDSDKTILESLDTLIDTVEIEVNQVFRGQSYASDNPISGNCEIQIEILKTKMNNGARDVVCQVTLTSTTDSPYKWMMLTRRTAGMTSSRISMPLTPMIADVNKKYVDNSLKNKVDKVTGKGLSTVDFTKSYETKLKGLENYNDTKVKEDIETIKENQIILVEDDTSMEGISDSVHDTLTTTNKKIIPAINELNSQYKEMAKQSDLIGTIANKVNMLSESEKVFYNSKLEEKKIVPIIVDSFYRIDSENLGTVENNKSIAWVTKCDDVNLKYGITNKKACLTSKASSDVRSVAFVDCGYSDCIIKARINISSLAGLSFRVTDQNNFLYVNVANTYLQLSKYENYSSTTLVNLTDIKLPNVVDVKIILKDSNIQIFINEILYIDSNVEFNKTSTKHGLYLRGMSNSSIEDFNIYRYESNNDIQSFSIPINLDSIPYGWNVENIGKDYSLVYDNVNLYNNNKSLKFTLKKIDVSDISSSKRSEIRHKSLPSMSECWYMFKTYIKDSYIDDVNPEIIFQFHDIPENNDSSNALSPNIAVTIKNGNYYLSQKSSEVRYPTQNNSTQLIIYDDVFLGKCSEDFNNWVSWKIHVKFGYNSMQEPLLELYKDDILVEKNTLPNCYNGEKACYFKLGIYKWDFASISNPSLTDERVINFADLKAIL